MHTLKNERKRAIERSACSLLLDGIQVESIFDSWQNPRILLHPMDISRTRACDRSDSIIIFIQATSISRPKVYTDI